MTVIYRTIGLLLVASLILAFGGALYSCNRTVEALRYTDDEKDIAAICGLPEDVLYKYIFIGRVNKDGAFVKSLWLDIHFYGYDRNQRLASSFGTVRNAYLNAESVGFNLRPSDPRHPDEDVVLTIKQLRRDCADAHRRANFDERFNDFLKYLGLTTLLAFTVWLLMKIGGRVPNWRK